MTSARKRFNLLELDAYPLGLGACGAHADFNSLAWVVGQGFGGSKHKHWSWDWIAIERE